MGFKIFSKRNGKRTVNDKPENSDTKVTRGEYFTKFPDNYRGKVSPDERVLGKSLTILGNLLCIAHRFGEEFAKTIREKLSVFSLNIHPYPKILQI